MAAAVAQLLLRPCAPAATHRQGLGRKRAGTPRPSCAAHAWSLFPSHRTATSPRAAIPAAGFDSPLSHSSTAYLTLRGTVLMDTRPSYDTVAKLHGSVRLHACDGQTRHGRQPDGDSSHWRQLPSEPIDAG